MKDLNIRVTEIYDSPTQDKITDPGKILCCLSAFSDTQIRGELEKYTFRLLFGFERSLFLRTIARVSITDPGYKLPVLGRRVGFKSFTGCCEWS